jgi:outer membrane receptor for ferrienterochelin and colicin
MRRSKRVVILIPTNSGEGSPLRKRVEFLPKAEIFRRPAPQNDNLLVLFAMLCFIFLISSSIAFASTQGTIEGTVKDKSSGEALVGVNVVIVGTQTGAATNLEGHYQISNVEVGTYTLRFSQVGYQSVLYKNVQVHPDRNTTINVELVQSDVKLQEVEVTAERPMIEKDVTSTNYSLGTSQIDQLPVQNVSDLVTMFPSVTAEGNVRGGKSTEVVYLIDGLPMQDLVSGGLSSALPKSSVTEFSLQTGGFEAEYGNALSGVVNIITRRGSDNATALLRVEHDQFLPNSIDQETNHASEMELTLSGPIIAERLHYFTANTIQLTDTRWWQDFDKFFPSPVETNISGLTKLDYTLSSKTNIALESIYSWHNWHDYEWSWRFDLNGLPREENDSYRNSIVISQTITPTVHFTQNLSQSLQHTHIGAPDKSSIDTTAYQYDFFLEYVESGSEAWWADTKQYIYTAKGDLDVQFTPLHILKVGYEFNQYDINSDVLRLEPQTTYFGKIITGAPLLNYSDAYNYLPRSGSMYVQDKLLVEKDGATVNLGLRWDFLDPRAERPNVEYVPVPGDTAAKQATPTQYVAASLKQQLSPRMGLSFPLAWNTLLIMNYGHYFQFPLFDYLYSGTTPQQLRVGIPVLVGNPDLLPERTHAWEIGLKYGINDKTLISATYFNKQFINQIDSKTLVASSAEAAGDFGFAEYVNNSYASAEGMEIVLSRHRGEAISGSLSYTLMYTSGVSDYVNQNINLAQWGFPVANTPYPLSWDERHAVKLDIEAKLPDDFTGNFVWMFNTGKPYTYYPTLDGYTAEYPSTPFVPNNARLPNNSTVNAKFFRRITLSPSNSFLLYGNVTNLFNNLNAKWADSNGRIGGQLGDPSAYYELRRFTMGIEYDL